MQQACHLGEEIPKLGRKRERNCKPQSSVGMVDTGGKTKDSRQEQKRLLKKGGTRPSSRVHGKMCMAWETSGRNQNATCCWTAAMLLNELRHGATGGVQWANTDFSGKTSKEGGGEAFVFSVKEQLVCRKLPYGMDNRLAESLRVRISKEATLWQECVTGHLIKMRK